MYLLAHIIDWIIPVVDAAQLQNAGSTNPSVATMWTNICTTLPFCSLGYETAPQYFATKIIAIVQSLVTSVAIIAILYASVLLSTVQVDEGRKEEAKNIIMYAVIGLVLSVIASAFLNYLLITVFPQLFQ